MFELTVPDLYLVNDFKLGFMFVSTFNVSRLWVQDKGNLICIALRHFLEGRGFFYTQCHNCAAWSGDYFYCHTYRSLLLLEEAVDARPYIQISSSFLFSRAVLLFVTYWSALFCIFCSLFKCSLLIPLPYNRIPYCIWLSKWEQ